MISNEPIQVPERRKTSIDLDMDDQGIVMGAVVRPVASLAVIKAITPFARPDFVFDADLSRLWGASVFGDPQWIAYQRAQLAPEPPRAPRFLIFEG